MRSEPRGAVAPRPACVPLLLTDRDPDLLDAIALSSGASGICRERPSGWAAGRRASPKWGIAASRSETGRAVVQPETTSQVTTREARADRAWIGRVGSLPLARSNQNRSTKLTLKKNSLLLSSSCRSRDGE